MKTHGKGSDGVKRIAHFWPKYQNSGSEGVETSLLTNAKLTVINLFLRVLFYVLGRSLGPLSLTCRDIVVLNEAVVILLAHWRHTVRVHSTSSVHGKPHFQA